MTRPRPARRLPFAFTELDGAVGREPVYLEASDGAQTSGMLYTPAGGRARTAVYLMHPRGDFTRHYVVPGLTGQQYAVFGHNSRYLNNDTDMVHERLLFDIAAGMRFLREHGFERVVLLGNSGGASLFSFYQQQAERAPGERLTAAPDGDAVPLSEEEMPPGDAYIAVAAHPGEGRFILNVLDPAVIDESRPELSDRDWDMYMEHNGYQPWPQPSSYDRSWLAEYRKRQRDRCRRLDAIARQYIAEQAYYRAELREPDFGERPAMNRAAMTRRARLWRYMVVYRTLANPAYLDPTIDPNERRLGSIFSPGDPIIGNYGPGGLARVMTPRGWLSTWSGTSSQADLPDTIGGVSVPTLVVYPTGDSDIYPSEQRAIFERAGAEDKTFVELPGADHYLFPLEGTEGDPRDRLIEILAPWLGERA